MPARAGFAVFATLLLLLAQGCSSYEKDVGGIIAGLRGGDVDSALRKARGQARDAGETDRLLWQLEWGATARAGNSNDESIRAFDGALETLAGLDQKAGISVSDETLATLDNLSSLPYLGTHYDRIMLSTYQALNHLRAGEYDKARVDLNLAQQRQLDAVDANAAKIEKSREKAAAKSGKQSFDISRTLDSPQFKDGMKRNHAESDALSGYADYVNPFSTWLHGIFFLTNATGGSDVERAHKSLQRAAGMAPDNNAARADLELARRLREGAPLDIPPTTYVIFETGLAPVRREFRVDVPLFIATSKVPYVGVAFPRIEYVKDFAPALTVETGDGKSVTTQTIASMDRIVTADFNEARAEIVTRSLVSTLTKAAISYGINTAGDAAMRNDTSGYGTLVWFGTRIASILYSHATTKADLRTWHTLPKEFQIARFPTPPTRRVKLTGPGGRHETDIAPGRVNVIHVRSFSRNSRPVISQFVLRP
jgi:hypothetical protein